jgi:hypothetical protein
MGFCGGNHHIEQVFNIPFNIPFLFRPLLHAQNYLWCRANPTMSISLFGLLNIPVPCEMQPFTVKRDGTLTRRYARRLPHSYDRA